MNPAGIMTAMQNKNLLLQEKNDQIVPLAEAKANAQRDYRVALAKDIAVRRLKGESVSLCEIMGKGQEEVADKKVLSVISDAEYKACISSITISLAALDTLRSLLTWEREEKYNKNV